MVRIWYSIQGDGLGHALRSAVVISHLLQKHELMITVNAKRPYNFLRSKFGDRVHLMKGETFLYKDNKVLVGKSIKKYLKERPKYLKENIKNLFPIIIEFKPQIIMNDFESEAHYFSMITKIPCISLDNIHILTECYVQVPTNTKFGLKGVTTLIKILHPRSDEYIIPAFANATPKRKNKTHLTNPILREEILKLKPEEKDFVLVYQTTKTNKDLTKILSKRKQKYKIYGMGKKKKTNNLEFKDFNEKKFMNDLRKAKYVIVNGGFTVITEALYLKKPVLAVPIENQFEQEFNGFTLRNRGYGDYTQDVSSYDFDGFEMRLKFFKHNLKKLKKWDNSHALKIVDRLINKHSKRILKFEKINEILKRW